MTTSVGREITRYGFRYGALTVERTADANGYVVVTLLTPYERVEVEVSPKGRRMRFRGPFKRVAESEAA
jgi:hypothetical protein